MIRKKSLGQHFLRGDTHLAKVVGAAAIERGEVVLEIGPGEGALTEKLLAAGAGVVAIEKDHRLIPLLREKFKDQPFTLFEDDALTADIRTFNLPKKYKVVANIPYYITGGLFKKFLSAQHQPERVVFLVQKEVGERIARSKKESILSLSVKAYGTPRYVATVPRGAFVPPPAVDSAILLIEQVSRERFENAAHEKKFFELVRAGFAHKRKLLVSNIAPLLGTKHSNILENVGISQKARAEDVSLAQWLQLARS